MKFPVPPWTLALAGLFACTPVVSGVEPAPLGYGPGSHVDPASGYDPDPVPRPSPTPWQPPRRANPNAPVTELGAAVNATVASAPAYSPDVVRVCGHLGEIGEAADPQLCHRRYRIARVFRTIANWKTLAACIEAAGDAAAVRACEQATPRAVGIIDEHARESKVCLHLFALMVLEELGPEPMLDDEDMGDFNELMVDCVDTFVVEERADRNPAEYGDLLDCIGAASSTADADLCE